MSWSNDTKHEGRAHTPKVVWRSEPSPEWVVRAGLCLLGMSAAEIERSLRETPVREEESSREDEATDET